jgi:hypothetical protein
VPLCAGTWELTSPAPTSHIYLTNHTSINTHIQHFRTVCTKVINHHITVR